MPERRPIPAVRARTVRVRRKPWKREARPKSAIWSSMRERKRRMAMISLRMVSASMWAIRREEQFRWRKKVMETEESEAMMAAQKARQFQGLKDWRPKKGGREYQRKEKRNMKSRFSPTARERTERRFDRMWNMLSWNLQRVNSASRATRSETFERG